MEMRGIEPRTSRMQSERSTVWATSPCEIWIKHKQHVVLVQEPSIAKVITEPWSSCGWYEQFMIEPIASEMEYARNDMILMLFNVNIFLKMN